MSFIIAFLTAGVFSRGSFGFSWILTIGVSVFTTFILWRILGDARFGRGWALLALLAPGSGALFVLLMMVFCTWPLEDWFNWAVTEKAAMEREIGPLREQNNRLEYEIRSLTEENKNLKIAITECYSRIERYSQENPDIIRAMSNSGNGNDSFWRGLADFAAEFGGKLIARFGADFAKNVVKSLFGR